MLLERNPPFSFEALLGRPVGSPEDQEGALVAPGRGREPSESPSRSSGSPVTFSWFSEGRGTLSPSCSSKLSPLSSPRHQKPHSQVWEEPLSPMSSWTTQQVCQWLKGLNLEQYVPEFSANEVDGRQLLQMDGKALKGLGVLSASDRAALKRRIKDVQSAAEKQRKAVEKMEKQRRRKQEQCSN
ncbi:hypothetical protein fugu_015282 [Takifugu bimaculatus]|uniref:SAM domain-containing protein n=1 Tax=Takifugu bimaculatus TaxID=433685 RepID=A0A4Z2C002_9TELE|nr:hypothetical protein fugu_015282 [Takifugu bimaculatus]